MITGLNHITLSVSELGRSFRFYTDTLGFEPLARWPKGAYFSAAGLWLALVVDAQVRSEPLPEYTHIAFSVSPEDFARLAARILADPGAGQWQENWTEGDSLYFTDPDGHKLCAIHRQA